MCRLNVFANTYSFHAPSPLFAKLPTTDSIEHIFRVGTNDREERGGSTVIRMNCNNGHKKLPMAEPEETSYYEW